MINDVTTVAHSESQGISIREEEGLDDGNLFHTKRKATVKTTLAYFIDPSFIGPVMQLLVPWCYLKA